MYGIVDFPFQAYSANINLEAGDWVGGLGYVGVGLHNIINMTECSGIRFRLKGKTQSDLTLTEHFRFPGKAILLIRIQFHHIPRRIRSWVTMFT